MGRVEHLVKRLLLVLLVLGTPSLFGSCFEQSSLHPPPKAARRPTPPAAMTVMIAIDGVRWQEVFQGVDRDRARRLSLPLEDAPRLMPNLHAIIRDYGCAVGAPGSGYPISASGPNFVSLPGYTEMFTGAPAIDCPNNECGRVRRRTLVDDAVALDSAMGRVAVVTSWPKVALAVSQSPSSMVVSAGRSGGSNQRIFHRYPETLAAYQRGKAADPKPGSGDFRPDRLTQELALSYLAHERPSFLFVGLGETDEFAHKNDYVGYLRALRAADGMIGAVHQLLLAAERRGVSTLLFVTSDHGRSDFVHHGAAYPESARTWLVAAGSTVTARGSVNSPVPRTLSDLAPTLRFIWGLDASESRARARAPALGGHVLGELF